jgi:hypothetical protein
MDCYQQARLLAPDNGNPSHQLAILSLHAGDVFSSTLHYYRALCIRQPFPTAQENLEKTLGKALEKHRKVGRNSEPQPAETPLEALQRDVVLLHALWFLKSRGSNLPKHSKSVLEQFSTLVSECSIPTETIVRVLVMALGALWNVRTHKEAGQIKTTVIESGSSSSSKSGSFNPEFFILAHILDIFRALMQIGISQMKEEPPSTPGGQSTTNLAQVITSVFRRTLPALRIASKWLIENLEYVQKYGSARTPSSDAPPVTSQQPDIVETINQFWIVYAAFATQIPVAFPPTQLPELTVPMEEDIDLRGFAPLPMFEVPSAEKSAEVAATLSQFHPNEEQLMRISDLYKDAVRLAESEKSPLKLGDGVFSTVPFKSAPPPTLRRPPVAAAPPPQTPARRDITPTDKPSFESLYDEDDGNATDSTRTEDDPVSLAMRATLIDGGNEFDDDEEEILYPQRGPTSLGKPSSPTLPLVASPNAFPPVLSSAGSPLSKTQAMPQTSTTAEDLLMRVLGGGNSQMPLPTSPNHTRRISIPTAPLLFGATSPTSGGNIWASPPDERLSPLGPTTPSLSTSFAPTLPSPQRPIGHQRQFSASQNVPWSTPIATHKAFPSSPPLSPHAPTFSPTNVVGSPNSATMQRTAPPLHQQQYFAQPVQAPAQPLNYQPNVPYYAGFTSGPDPHRPWA